MDYSIYKTKIKYPQMPRPPHLGKEPTAEQARAYAAYMDEYPALKAKWEIEKDIYYRDNNRLEAQFKNDVLEEVGLTNFKNADKVYRYAWDKGHSDGLSSVHAILEELAEIIL